MAGNRAALFYGREKVVAKPNALSTDEGDSLLLYVGIGAVAILGMFLTIELWRGDPRSTVIGSPHTEHR